MNPGDRARITRGPWAGFEGRVTATFTTGDLAWVSVLIRGMERTFPAADVQVIP